ncbi:MAG: PGPGW domain-containing protein [Actinobacteria bacterium]|nr:PGPGW domain-containing protein [Actinomycetota bacterium]
MEYKKIWHSVPSPVRKTIVLVIGFTLIAIGAVLIVLPGPFTLPFVIGGLFVLAAEFTWAKSLLTKAQESAKKVDPRKLRKRKSKEN